MTTAVGWSFGFQKSLHKNAALTAEREGTSLNQFIVYSLAETIGERRPTKVGSVST